MSKSGIYQIKIMYYNYINKDRYRHKITEKKIN